MELSNRKEPFFEHDCEDCEFLGRGYVGTKKYDFYVHWSAHQRTVMARYGSKGSAYMSGVEAALVEAPLGMALHLAIDQGKVFEQIQLPVVLRAFLGDKLALRFLGYVKKINKAYRHKPITEVKLGWVRDEVTRALNDLWVRIPEKERPSFDKCPSFRMLIKDKTSLAVEFEDMSLSSETFFEPAKRENDGLMQKQGS